MRLSRDNTVELGVAVAEELVEPLFEDAAEPLGRNRSSDDREESDTNVLPALSATIRSRLCNGKNGIRGWSPCSVFSNANR